MLENVLIWFGVGITNLIGLFVVIVLLFGVPWQAYRRGNGALSWFVLQIVALNPFYPMILLALLPDKAKLRLRDQFTRELDHRLARSGRKPAVMSHSSRGGIDRSVGDLPTMGASLGDISTNAVVDHSIGDQETRMPEK